MRYRVIRGAAIGKPSANFLVVNEHNEIVGNDAVGLLGFPTKKLALGWKRRLEHADRAAEGPAMECADYEAAVIETQTCKYIYRVEADSLAEAEEKCLSGETVESIAMVQYGETINRQIVPGTLKKAGELPENKTTT